MRDYGIPICSDIDHDVAILHFDLLILLCRVIIATFCVFCEPELADWNVTSSHMVGVVRRMATPVVGILFQIAQRKQSKGAFWLQGNDYGTVANSKVVKQTCLSRIMLQTCSLTFYGITKMCMQSFIHHLA